MSYLVVVSSVDFSLMVVFCGWLLLLLLLLLPLLYFFPVVTDDCDLPVFSGFLFLSLI